MIGLIGYQDDAIGFGLAGVQHVQEVPPNATKTDVTHAFNQLTNQGIEILIIPKKLEEYLEETDLLVLAIPHADTNNTQQIDQLTKELLGVQL